MAQVGNGVADDPEVITGETPGELEAVEEVSNGFLEQKNELLKLKLGALVKPSA